MSRGPVFSGAIPKRPGVSWKTWGSGLLLLAVLVWSYSGTEANFRDLIGEEGRSQMWKFVSGLWPPETSLKFLGGAAWAAVQTLAISIMGTVLAVIIAFVLMAFASENLMVRGVLFERAGAGTPAGRLRYAGYWAARTAMAVLRSVPEIVLAIIFIFGGSGIRPFAYCLLVGIVVGTYSSVAIASPLVFRRASKSEAHEDDQLPVVDDSPPLPDA